LLEEAIPVRMLNKSLCYIPATRALLSMMERWLEEAESASGPARSRRYRRRGNAEQLSFQVLNAKCEAAVKQAMMDAAQRH
jgi:hypothetical protein